MKCTVCGEEVEKYWDNGQELDPTMHILVTKHNPVTGAVEEGVCTASGHADCMEHRGLWARLMALEETVRNLESKDMRIT